MSELSLKEQILQKAFDIDPTEIKRLGMPYDTFLQEGKELVLWAKEDVHHLNKSGFKSSMLKETELAYTHHGLIQPKKQPLP